MKGWMRYGGVVLVLCGLPACSDAVGTNGEDGEETCRPVAVEYHDALAQNGAIRDVHDPVVMRQEDTYYLFSTGHGIPIRRSDDLVSWSAAGRVFTEDVPAWAGEEVAGVAFPWAPDIAHFNERYHLYYSLSTFGSQRSVIGLATNTTLDPADQAYEWVDQGKVIESRPMLNDFNAIDPNVAFDEAGTPWLTWGSYWGGIRMRRLDAETGLPPEGEDMIHPLASRPGDTAIEAPFLIRRGGYYYLFVSFDACCQGTESTYKIRVGRSEEITGPYVDHSGQLMMEGGGTLVLEGYGRIRGPGHNAVLTDGDRHYLVHHFYDAESNGIPTLQVRSLVWDAEGWPLAGYPYDDDYPDPGAEPEVAGRWGHSVDFATPYQIELLADGTIEMCNGGGSWSRDGATLAMNWTSGASGESQVEQFTVSSDGTWYVGRTDDGTIIHGARTD